MFVTVVAVMCKMMVSHPTIAPSGDCTPEEAQVEEVVTSSDLDPSVDFMGCMIHSQIGISDWKQHNPRYFKDNYRVARIRCVPGHYVIKGEI